MNTFILGGTGFIGYHSALEFLKRGHSVTTLSLPDIELGSWFPDEIQVKYRDVFEMDFDELIGLFIDFDCLVYALGPDDRFTPDPPAYKYFHEYLVEKCGRIVSAARLAGVKRCVVLNSYFAYFDRKFPEYNLSEHHPYIKCRVEQAERVISEGMGKMDVMVLELPYIFGTMPGREPLWKDVLRKMRADGKIILYPKGGSSMISVEHVAEAIAGAAEQGKNGKRYTIGDSNLTWVEMLKIMTEAMGKGRKIIITIPCFPASVNGILHKMKDRRAGRESGLDYYHLFKDILCRNFFYDPSESALELGYGRGGIRESIKKTIRACLD